MRFTPNWLRLVSVAGGLILLALGCTDAVSPRSTLVPHPLFVDGPLPHGITYSVGAPPTNADGGGLGWAYTGANILPGTTARVYASGDLTLRLNPDCYEDPTWAGYTSPMPPTGEANSAGKVLVDLETSLDFPTQWSAAASGGLVSYMTSATSDTTPVRIMAMRNGGYGVFCTTYPPGAPPTPSEFAYYIEGATNLVIDLLGATVTASASNIQPGQAVNFTATPINFAAAAEISWTFDTLAFEPQIDVVTCNNQPTCSYSPPKSGRMQACLHDEQNYPVCSESPQVAVAVWINGAPACRAKVVASYTRISLRYDSTDIYHDQPHMGQDYADSIGTPVFSADSGTVLYADWAQTAGYAVAVRSAKPDARGLLLDSYYYHLKQGSLAVHPGQPVSAGQFLASSDDSGVKANGKPSSHGPHVHFEQHTQTPGKGAFPKNRHNDRATGVVPCTF
jgi:murein DD-endopeptidase MepM/ murein hydrolase activator NlpD